MSKLGGCCACIGERDARVRAACAAAAAVRMPARGKSVHALLRLNMYEVIVCGYKKEEKDRGQNGCSLRVGPGKRRVHAASVGGDGRCGVVRKLSGLGWVGGRGRLHENCFTSFLPPRF